MKPILIIKTGQAISSIPADKGNFEDWIISKMSISRQQAIIADVYQGSSLPNLDQIAGVVITGSSSMVTQHEDWSEKTAQWLKDAIKQDFPILGICYGHQLLAYALGGEVGKNPKGREFGTVDIYLPDNTNQDLLFRGFPASIKAHVCHHQSVLKLPDNATLLAFNDIDNHQAFRVGSHVWGVQFHPEFDTEIVQEYIKNARDKLTEDGQNTDRLIEQTTDTPYSNAILERFVKVVKGDG